MQRDALKPTETTFITVIKAFQANYLFIITYLSKVVDSKLKQDLHEQLLY